MSFLQLALLLSRSQKMKAYRQARAGADALTDADLADMGLKRYQLGHVARVKAFKGSRPAAQKLARGHFSEHRGFPERGIHFRARCLKARRVLPPAGFSLGLGLHMPAELVAQRREQFFGKGVAGARTEAGEDGGGQNFGRHRLLDRRLHRPAALARIGDGPGETIECGILGQCDRRQVEEPGGDDAAPPPRFARSAIS